MFKRISLILATVLVPVAVMVAGAGQSSAASAGGLIAITNSYRAANGLGALSYNAALTSAAYAKANDMLVHQYWAHTSPSGVGPWYWISSAGYPYYYAGENLAQGSADDGAIISAWMGSPEHRANLLSPNFRDMGCGFASGVLLGVNTTVAVCDFGSTYSELHPAPVYSAPAPTYQASAGAPSGYSRNNSSPADQSTAAQSNDQPVGSAQPAAKPAVPDYFKKSVLVSHPRPAAPVWLTQLNSNFGRTKLAAHPHSFFLGSWLTVITARYHF